MWIMLTLQDVLYCLSLKLGFTPCKAEQPTTRHGVTRKEAQKRLQVTENLFRKNLQLKDIS